MSKGFLCSSFSQGGYLICAKQRRNSTRSSFRNDSWLTMIGFFGINHHDFLQLKEPSSAEMNMIRNHLHILFETVVWISQHPKLNTFFNMKVHD